MTRNAGRQIAVAAVGDDQVPVLLVEDDDGDALLPVRAGAQDYLVKGEVSGRMLNRVIRFAVERRCAGEVQRALHVAQVRAQENARPERGIPPAAPLGLSEARDWPGIEVRLDGNWPVLLYTDGLSRAGSAKARNGSAARG